VSLGHSRLTDTSLYFQSRENKNVGAKWSFPNGAELPSYTANFCCSNMTEVARLHLKIVTSHGVAAGVSSFP
jgi:hypothetical protein